MARNKTIGQKLRDIREKSNVSRADAAKVLGIHWQAYVAIERNTRAVTSEQIEKLADFYGVAPQKLIPRECLHKFAFGGVTTYSSSDDEAVRIIKENKLEALFDEADEVIREYGADATEEVARLFPKIDGIGRARNQKGG